MGNNFAQGGSGGTHVIVPEMNRGRANTEEIIAAGYYKNESSVQHEGEERGHILENHFRESGEEGRSMREDIPIKIS